jgi:L-lactate utilization protein LutC
MKEFFMMRKLPSRPSFFFTIPFHFPALQNSANAFSCPKHKLTQALKMQWWQLINGETIDHESTFDKANSRAATKDAIIKAKSELYEAKKEALEEYVFNKLITMKKPKRKTCRRKNIMKNEVDAKVKKPSTDKQVDRVLQRM